MAVSELPLIRATLVIFARLRTSMYAALAKKPTVAAAKAAILRQPLFRHSAPFTYSENHDIIFNMLVSFPPLVGENPKILILGSMPGEVSLRMGQYYAHPQNRFWKILFRYFSAPFSGDYAARENLAVQNGVALWDTIQSCERENSSLDSAIKSIIPNDVAGFLARHPNIKAIFTNGGKSRGIFEKHRTQIPDAVSYRPLPSTSPANARMNLDSLYTVWAEALSEFLGR